MPTSYLMHAYSRQPVSFERGSGALLWDTNGREYLDAIAGVAVTNLGHAHPEIAAAIADQAGRLIHTSNLFGIEWQERLGARLCALAGMDKAFFCNSGAEANETALKLARLHAQRRGIAQPLVVVMDNSFHGRTFATLAASGNPAVQQGFAPLMPGFIRVPFNDIAALRQCAEEHPDIVAVLVEPVQGEGGVHVASPAYLQQLRALCDVRGWLMMMDEIQTGLGRTGAWFGFNHAGIVPDVITLAKALGNGVPIGACLARSTAAALFVPGNHGSTFGGNPLACRVGCCVLDISEREQLPLRAKQLGEQLLRGLQVRLAGHPGVRGVRGHGLMIAIEMAAPCTPLVERALRTEALLINVTRERTIRLLPPLICTPVQIDQIVERLSRLVLLWLTEQAAAAVSAQPASVALAGG
ncbi:aspartate aminotransferase family protein [Jeongeupia naejangsanensis]|uniref:Acetylornithine aminotransferase n=1 Tax=Jeongeupia naejangsanensis TaxID=613195 RepID=A0ABS2BMH7_9NEIS|nr:aspartate aminotransferase family protein [Jeongeupia naejangsanensis]MBM3116812.1 aspartate aminotransferase family protein [Jeongeupia naejangsanensis]